VTRQPRELHVRQALDVIDYALGPVEPVVPAATDLPGAERLVACDKFVLIRHTIDGDAWIGGDDRFHLLAVIGGVLQIDAPHVANPLEIGQTVLVPAASRVGLRGEDATVLDVHLPHP
jgi:mannose-6-phosphate isomerase